MVRPRRSSRLVPFFILSLAIQACGDSSSTAPEPSPDPTYWGSGSSVYWNQAARELLASLPPQQANPIVQARVFAYLSIAQYNAIVTAEQAAPGASAPSPGAAAAGASEAVLKALLPTLQAQIDARLATQLTPARWPADRQRFIDAGLTTGREIGAQVVAYAATDRALQTPAPPNPGGPGAWRGTNPITALYGARLLVLESPNQFLPPPPPAFGSSAFESALAETRTIAQGRTPEQVNTAIYWAPRNNAALNETVADLVLANRRAERDAARLFALANMAGFDQLNACFAAKFAYYYIRPTQADPTIPFIPGVPLPNHPSYPSGHSCATGAYVAILEREFPGERARLAALVTEASLSRIVAGFHYRFDVDAGERLGRAIGEWVWTRGVPSRGPIPLD
jgi:membrane-associated phospholipid phosphatase